MWKGRGPWRHRSQNTSLRERSNETPASADCVGSLNVLCQPHPEGTGSTPSTDGTGIVSAAPLEGWSRLLFRLSGRPARCPVFQRLYLRGVVSRFRAVVRLTFGRDLLNAQVLPPGINRELIGGHTVVHAVRRVTGEVAHEKRRQGFTACHGRLLVQQNTAPS